MATFQLALIEVCGQLFIDGTLRSIASPSKWRNFLCEPKFRRSRNCMRMPAGLMRNCRIDIAFALLRSAYEFQPWLQLQLLAMAPAPARSR